MRAHAFGLIIILNDNEMSIAPPARLVRLSRAPRVGGTYRSVRETAKQLGRHLPKFIYDRARKTESSRGISGQADIVRELGSIMSDRSMATTSIICFRS